MPDSVIEIADSTFWGCSSLTSINIPDSVTSIRPYAFYGCSSLTSITIPDNVIEIEYGTFYGCSSLLSITIPDSVAEIVLRAFYDCSSLTSIIIPNNVTEIGENSFHGCEKLTIYGYKGSYAETYATKNDIPFVFLGEYVEPEVMYGDIDGDGGVGKMADIVMLAKYLKGNIKLNSETLAKAQCTKGDSVIDTA
ncbi:MAG: leucine-rich repeat protein, partial [Oscillospiraceae bacterium]|nr:leucine-rich repeat protein [Oscillospiraceae bacterium]